MVVATQICFTFTPIWRRFPFWRAYFSKGLKPPTSYIVFRGAIRFLGTRETWSRDLFMILIIHERVHQRLKYYIILYISKFLIRSCISNWYCSAMWLVSKFYFHTTCFGKLNPLWWAYSSKWVAQAPFLHPNGCLMLVVLQQKSGGVTKTTAWFSKMEQNQTKHCTSWFSYPWHPCMVYFTYIYHRFKPDLDKYTIHGCYGIGDLFFLQWSLSDYVAFVFQRWDSDLGCELFISWICRTFFRCLARDLQKWSKGV